MSTASDERFFQNFWTKLRKAPLVKLEVKPPFWLFQPSLYSDKIFAIDLIDGKLTNQKVVSLFDSYTSIVLLGWGKSPSKNLVSHVVWKIPAWNLRCFLPHKYDMKWKFRCGNNLRLMVFFFYNFQGEVMQFWRGNDQQTVWSWAAMWNGRSK